MADAEQEEVMLQSAFFLIGYRSVPDDNSQNAYSALLGLRPTQQFQLQFQMDSIVFPADLEGTIAFKTLHTAEKSGKIIRTTIR